MNTELAPADEFDELIQRVLATTIYPEPFVNQLIDEARHARARVAELAEWGNERNQQFENQAARAAEAERDRDANRRSAVLSYAAVDTANQERDRFVALAEKLVGCLMDLGEDRKRLQAELAERPAEESTDERRPADEGAPVVISGSCSVITWEGRTYILESEIAEGIEELALPLTDADLATITTFLNKAGCRPARDNGDIAMHRYARALVRDMERLKVDREELMAQIAAVQKIEPQLRHIYTTCTQAEREVVDVVDELIDQALNPSPRRGKADG